MAEFLYNRRKVGRLLSILVVANSIVLTVLMGYVAWDYHNSEVAAEDNRRRLCKVPAIMYSEYCAVLFPTGTGN